MDTTSSRSPERRGLSRCGELVGVSVWRQAAHVEDAALSSPASRIHGERRVHVGHSTGLGTREKGSVRSQPMKRMVLSNTHIST